MHWTQMLIPTMREVPKDAEATSHQLMIRAGMIRKLSSGVYSYLPLGFRVLQKVAAIIRDEMNKAGAEEILMPAIQPLDLWKKSGRYSVLKDILIEANTRGNQKIVFGPTHEEVVTELLTGYVKSYQDLPKILFQIQTKFRDEARPRFGVIRSKEFLMKDAYSFDTDFESLDKNYQKMYQAYCKIFSRCGLDYISVSADPGAMGGDVSHEFMVKIPFGEDRVVTCEGVEGAWNREVASGVSPEIEKDESLYQMEVFDTPGISTIEQLQKKYKINAQSLVKTLIYVADGQVVACLLRGDHELAENKLKKILKAKEVHLADEATIKKVTGAPVGFAGPIGLKDIKIVADISVQHMSNFVVGANEADKHLKNVNLERDFKVARFDDIRYVEEGDLHPESGRPLKMEPALEIGHVFKLGTKYSSSLDLTFLDPKGDRKHVVMGCYGIGVNRIIAAAIEQNHDEKGICWPLHIAPFDVIIVTTNESHEESKKVANELYAGLQDAGIDVLYDDRQDRAGVKFNDAELIGFPIQVVVGERNLKNNEIEIKIRKSLKINKLSISSAVEHITQWVKNDQY